jgi:hypothetical protein
VLLSPDSRLSGVEIDYSRDDGPGLWGNVSSIDHVSIASKGTGISLSNDTKPSVSIANTSVHATGDGGWGLAISNVRAAPDFTLDVVLRNVTIVDEGTDAPAFWPYSVGINGAKSRLNAAVSNSILRGKDYDVSAGASNAGDGTSVALDHSSFATVRTYGSGTKSATAADVNGNQAAAPLLAADLRQVAGSPTIDAGAADPQAGTTDLEGDPRVVGDAPDIGADEYVTPPPPPPPPPPPHGADDGSSGGSTGSDTGASPNDVAPPVQEDAAGGQTTPGPGPGAGGPAAKPPIALCVVPRLTGKTLKAARAALAKAGCVTGKVASRRVPRKAGKVVTQAAKPGVRLKAGAKVGLVIGRR